MRPAAAALALCLTGLLGACATRPAGEQARIRTTREANTENIQGAVSAPLRDVNVVRTKIPEVLLEAMADPYARPEPASCRRIAALVGPLDEALGHDLDLPRPDEIDRMQQGKDAALGVMASLASDAIPFRTWVRKLSGAEAHDQLVHDAIIAGAVRRAYLKGLGETRGCLPPATPSHVLSQPRTPPQTFKTSTPAAPGGSGYRGR